MRTFSENGSQEYGILPFDKSKLQNEECEIVIFSPSIKEDFNQMNVCKIRQILVVPF